jgi:hypothetical protein
MLNPTFGNNRIIVALHAWSCVIIVAACCSMVLSLFLFLVWRSFWAWIEVFLLSKEGTRFALFFLCSENRLLEEK